MVPGKRYTPEDFVVIAWRYRWVILLPLVLFTAIAGAVAHQMPNKFRSETTVLVVPQRVPEAYVHATVTTKISDRVLSIREQILSRSRLERIIDELHLYASERQKMPMEAIIEQMRLGVSTHIVREDAFSVSFVAQDPQVAQKVTERLAGMFSEENMRDREVLAESTNQFFQTQLDDARHRLKEQETAVEAYRRQYAGELPEQLPSNMQAIQNTEIQIQTLTQALNSDRDRRLVLERQLVDATSADASQMPPPGQPIAPNAPPTLAQQLEAAQSAERALAMRVTPEHPDLVQARLAVQRLQKQLDAERASTASGAPAPAMSAAEVARRNHLNDLHAQMDAIDRQIAQKTEEEKRLRDVVASYRTKVEAAPRHETDLVSLTRDYETLQQQYKSLLQKSEESKVAANVERRQIGEQFRILDPARVPVRPFTPNRPAITAAGAGAGLFMGLLCAAMLEFRDRTLRSQQDVALCCSLPVLAVLPVVYTDAELSHKKRVRVALWACGTTVVAAGTVVLALWRNGMWRG